VQAHSTSEATHRLTTRVSPCRNYHLHSLGLDSAQTIAEMPSDHPHTPQSPLPYGSTDLPSKPITPPKTGESLPTPAHSINGSMSSTASDLAIEGAHLEESSSKRKRDLEDHGDREQKKVHVEDSRIRIEDLHLDVGKIYSLCRTRKAPFFLEDLPILRISWHM
jgi:hypothetical protein